VSSTSSLADLWDYRRTRFPLRLFVPLALFLALAADAVAPAVVALALSWLFQLRLADDLADRRRDALRHPDRVLVRAAAGPFAALLALLAAGNVLLTAWLLPGPRWAEYLALTVLLQAWYFCVGAPPSGGLPQPNRPGSRRPPEGGTPTSIPASLVVLLKYPALVYLLRDPGGRFAWPLAGRLALVYGCFVAYEILHDHRLCAGPEARVWLAASLALMTAGALLLAGRLVRPGCYVAGCVVPGAAALALLWRLRHRPHPWPYVVFLVASVWTTFANLLPPPP
jgi:hypothetical protein